MQAAHDWHDAHDLPWTEDPPPNNPQFANRWFFRLQDLVDKYQPDFLYLDNTGLPLGQAGLDAAANYYNSNGARHGGTLEGVLTDKGQKGDRMKAATKAWERGRPNEIQPQPFEADTCIGDWHYRKDITYKTVREVVQMLVDVVSKNGTMLLSIPLRGDGTIDEREEAFLHGLAGWMAASSEGIFGSRPWKVYGEGPTPVPPRARRATRPSPYTPADIRFTTKGGHSYLLRPVAPLPRASP